jgi:hypothetical protein
MEQPGPIELAEPGIADQALLEPRLSLIHRQALAGHVAEAAAALLLEIAHCSDDEWHANLAVFLGASLAALRPDIAGNLLTRRFSPAGHIAVRTSAGISKDWIVLFEKIGRNRISLTLSDRLARHPDPKAHMLWLMWVMPLLVRVGAAEKVTDGAAFLNQWDAGIVPGLTYCANGSGFFLIPDNVFIPTEGYRHLKRELAQNVTDWSQRVPVAFWRGATTGQIVDPSRGWRSLQRVRLCELSQLHPELIDAGLSAIVQCPADVAAEIRNLGLLKDYFPADKLQAYRYLIDVDGNSNAWGGLFERLLTGSPVLKIASPRGYQQWYYDRLRPWHHYVPVAADLSDLVSKIQWLIEHDTQARRIGENGRALAYSIDYEAELDSAVDTVAAAFRAYSAAHMAALNDDGRTEPEKIISTHGTVLAYSLLSRTLVHVFPELLPLHTQILPLSLRVEADFAHLVTPSGEYIVGIRPDGSAEFNLEPEKPPAALRAVRKVEGGTVLFAFQLRELFLCAEDDGRVTVSRQTASHWESFRVGAGPPG